MNVEWESSFEKCTTAHLWWDNESEESSSSFILLISVIVMILVFFVVASPPMDDAGLQTYNDDLSKWNVIQTLADDTYRCEGDSCEEIKELKLVFKEQYDLKQERKVSSATRDLLKKTADRLLPNDIFLDTAVDIALNGVKSIPEKYQYQPIKPEKGAWNFFWGWFAVYVVAMVFATVRFMALFLISPSSEMPSNLHPKNFSLFGIFMVCLFVPLLLAVWIFMILYEVFDAISFHIIQNVESRRQAKLLEESEKKRIEALEPDLRVTYEFIQQSKIAVTLLIEKAPDSNQEIKQKLISQLEELQHQLHVVFDLQSDRNNVFELGKLLAIAERVGAISSEIKGRLEQLRKNSEVARDEILQDARIALL